MQVGLAQHNGACFAQRTHQWRILARLEVPQCRGSRRGRQVLRIDAVLDGDRQAVQGTELGTGAALAIAGARGLEHAVAPQSNEGIEAGAALALVQERARITLGADLAVSQGA